MNLGTIIGVASSQHLILRTPGWENEKNAPEIGTPVVNIQKEKIGTIYDVFGPVDKPFISVKLSNLSQLEKYEQLRGTTLFSMPKKKKTLQKRKPTKSGKRKFQTSASPKRRKPAQKSPKKDRTS